MIYKVNLNLAKLNEGIKKPIKSELPEIFKPLISTNSVIVSKGKTILEPEDFSKSGTLVYWKGCKRVRPVTTKILVERYLIPDLSRIFRHFITEDSFSRNKWNKCNIYLIHGVEPGKNPIAHKLIPNDPLYVMKDNQLSAEGVLFKNDTKLSKTFKLNESEIEVRYSIATRNVRLKHFGQSNINEKIGRNTGISIVREGREIDLDDFDYYKFDQRHRWWGCEIFFNKPCDIFFGVPANKQHTDSLKEAKEIDSVEGAEFPQDSPKENWPIWLTLDREFGIQGTISEYLKTIKRYGVTKTEDLLEDNGDNADEPEYNESDLPDDPSDEAEETTSGSEIEEKDSEAVANAKSELFKIGIENPTESQINRFLKNKVVLSYLPLGESLGFISISLGKGVCHLKINTDSNFYQNVMAELLARREEEGLEEVYRGIEIVFLAYARCMDLHRNYETSKEFPRVLRKWSAKVEELLEEYLE